MFPGLTELHLIGCLIELIWTPESKSNTSTPKTNSLTFWPKEISHVMSGIICYACSISVISVLQCALKQWRNDLNKIQEKNESKQNRDLWWILLRGRHRSCRPQFHWARGRDVTENKIPGNQLLEKMDRGDKETDLFEASDHYYHEQFMDSFSSTDYSKLDCDRAWSSQEWKAEATTYDRSGRPDRTSWRMVRQVRPDHEEILLDGTAQSVRYGQTLRERSRRPDNINSQEVANFQNFIMGSETTELELSTESRSFVNRVNDQVRKRQKIISNIAGEGEEHSIIWGMFMAVTMDSAVFMGKNYLNKCQFIVNTTDLTLKQMFDISAKLVAEQDEISNVDTIHWEKHSWKYLSLIGDETIINLQRAKVYVFSDSVLCLGRIHQHPKANEAWKNRIEWITTSQSYRDYDGISGEPTEFEWNIFAGFDTLQLCDKVKDLLGRLWETPENFTGRILFMSMFYDISCGTKDNERECSANAKVVSIYAKKFGIDNGHSLVPVPKRSGILWKRTVHKEFGTISRKRCCWNLPKAHVQFSVLRLHCLEVDSKAKVTENCRYTMQPIWKRLRLFFASLSLEISSVSTEQSQRYVKSMNPSTTERGDPLWWANQVPHSCSVWSRQKFLWRMTIQHIKTFYCNNMEDELRSCHNKINWVNFVWMQDFWVLLKSDSIS